MVRIVMRMMMEGQRRGFMSGVRLACYISHLDSSPFILKNGDCKSIVYSGTGLDLGPYSTGPTPQTNSWVLTNS
jgi:hypothetical protein